MDVLALNPMDLSFVPPLKALPDKRGGIFKLRLRVRNGKVQEKVQLVLGALSSCQRAKMSVRHSRVRNYVILPNHCFDLVAAATKIPK